MHIHLCYTRVIKDLHNLALTILALRVYGQNMVYEKHDWSTM